MRKRQTFQMPNRLILDVSLSYSAKRVGAVLFAHRNALGSCRKSLLELSALSGSIVSTVRSAIDELMGGGYIARKVGYRYSAAHGRVVYDKFTYFCNLDFGGGYTLAPRTLFGCKLHSTAFLLYLYLCYCAGQAHGARGRAHAATLGHTLPTARAALQFYSTPSAKALEAAFLLGVVSKTTGHC